MEPTPNSGSASPEQVPEEFNGIDPDDTRDVVMRGATFTVGVLPAGLWNIISTQNAMAFEESKRRAIAKLAAEGRDPESVEEGWTGTLAERTAATDEKGMHELARTRMEALKYGLRGHKGFKVKGKDVPFVTVSTNIDGIDVTVVTESTLRFYRANPNIVMALFLSLMKVNTLSDLAKKA